MYDDAVTGARVDVEVPIAMPAAEVWKLITDVSRVGEWSPECAGAAWLDGEGRPRVGARFEGRNQFAQFTSTVECVVTECDEPRTFAWVVLDPTGALDRPGSCWRYELLPGGSPSRTLVRHSFVHGPGDTGLRAGVLADPANAATVLGGRLDQLRHNMAETLNRMARARVARHV
jgi:uncharacterized protein YndB with AHSA1/START domain